MVSQGYKSPSSYQTPRPNYQKPSAYSPTPNYQQPAPQYPNNQQGFIKQNYSSLRNSTICKIGNSPKEVRIKKIKEFDPIHNMSRYILKCRRFFSIFKYRKYRINRSCTKLKQEVICTWRIFLTIFLIWVHTLNIRVPSILFFPSLPKSIQKKLEVKGRPNLVDFLVFSLKMGRKLNMYSGIFPPILYNVKEGNGLTIED